MIPELEQGKYEMNIDPQVRANFIRTLQDTIEIAKACGETASEGVLCALQGSLLAGHDRELLVHVSAFSERELEWIEAQRRNEPKA